MWNRYSHQMKNKYMKYNWVSFFFFFEWLLGINPQFFPFIKVVCHHMAGTNDFQWDEQGSSPGTSLWEWMFLPQTYRLVRMEENLKKYLNFVIKCTQYNRKWMHLREEKCCNT